MVRYYVTIKVKRLVETIQYFIITINVIKKKHMVLYHYPTNRVIECVRLYVTAVTLVQVVMVQILNTSTIVLSSAWLYSTTSKMCSPTATHLYLYLRAMMWGFPCKIMRHAKFISIPTIYSAPLVVNSESRCRWVQIHANNTKKKTVSAGTPSGR